MNNDISKDYAFFLEAINGLMVIDKHGKLIYINDQCADHIKVNREQSIGKHITEVFPISIMQNMLESESKYSTNCYFLDNKMSVSTQVQLRKNDEIVGVLEYDTFQDISGLDEFFGRYSASLNQELAYYKEQVQNFQSTKYSIKNIIGSSKKIADLKKQIRLAASTNSTVLIYGETGTGKELVAHSIHNLSSRVLNKFVKVNSAGMVESLVESELFGYEEGAFTGAKKGGKKGKFEIADQGTLFIDEINQMPVSVQPKLLRALQEGEISPVGSEDDKAIDVRIIAASNKNLYDMVKDGTFREDLYYRLNVFPINIPPLRERLDDIEELVKSKVQELNIEMGKNICHIDSDVYKKLKEYDWPGNIRELYNRIEAAMNYSTGESLCPEHLNLSSHIKTTYMSNLNTSKNPIEDVKKEAERELIKKTLIQCQYNKTKAAEHLKIDRSLLYQKMKRLGIK